MLSVLTAFLFMNIDLFKRIVKRLIFVLPVVLIPFLLAIAGDDGLATDSCTVNNELIQDSFPDAPEDRYSRLTELDYKRVADELGIEVATIKAVSDIEAGKSHTGFAEPGKPIINFDRTIFKSRLRKAGINVSRAMKNHPEAFARLNTRKYGSYSAAQYARLNSAMEIVSSVAKESAFWGMFQIGGFNWRKCDVSSVDEFVELMSESEAMQLELFARFIRANGMDKYLKSKNWRAFARAYNGSSYASRGYHKRLAAAYRKYKK